MVSNSTFAITHSNLADNVPEKVCIQMSNLYFRFLQIANAIQKESIPTLDENAIALLNMVALKHSQGRPMTVSQAMGLTALGSQTTLHRRLDALREAGFIEQVFQGPDRRIKYLVPTAAAQAYFTKMGSAFASIAQVGEA
jgi:DNA-binding MarR family transcriptional regulator